MTFQHEISTDYCTYYILLDKLQQQPQQQMCMYGYSAALYSLIDNGIKDLRKRFILDLGYSSLSLKALLKALTV